MHQNGSHMQDKALPKPRRVPTFKRVTESETNADSAAQVGVASLRGESSLSGQQLGHYTLIRQLGQGGYASIYLGVHHYLNTHVALKLLNRILAHLRHRHIVRVLDFGVERSTP